MRFRLLTAFAAAIYFLASCSSKPVDVVFDKAGLDSLSHKVLVDGKTVLNMKGDTAIALKLLPGKHFVQVNDSAKREFTVPENGGIVNLDNQEYVVYEVKYTSQSKSGGLSGGVNDLNSLLTATRRPYKVRDAVLIDSFIVFPKLGLPPSDSSLLKLLPELIQKGSISSARDERSVEGLKLVGKNQFFIEKFWDYNVTDSIPETIEVQTSKYSVGSESRTKTTVMEAKLFLISAMFSDSEQYVVKSIRSIREGKGDKEAQEEKESKQMEF